MLEHNNNEKLLKRELQELQCLKQLLKKSLEKVPEGSLHFIQKRGKNTEYYQYKGRADRKYIRKKEIAIAEGLAQKEYDTKLLEAVENRIQVGIEMLECYKSTLGQVYDELPNAKRRLVVPYELGDEEYIKQWYEKNLGGMNPFPINTNLYSNKGEHMRSKSEKIIADLLNKNNIPYIYEPKIELKNGHTVFPDFVILNVRLRKTFIYEHFGMMSDEQYGEKVSEKVNMYIMNEILPGDRFLFSMESQNRPLDTRVIEKLIDTYLI